MSNDDILAGPGLDRLPEQATVEVGLDGIACPILLTSCMAVDEAIAAGQVPGVHRANLFDWFVRTGRPIILLPIGEVATVEDLQRAYRAQAAGPEEIARTLSMDPGQVRLIGGRAR